MIVTQLRVRQRALPGELFLRYRQDNGKFRPAFRKVTGCNPAVMGFNDTAADGQTEAGASNRTRPALIKFFKDLFFLSGRQPWSLIRYGQPQFSPGQVARNFYESANRCIFYSIFKEVDEDSLHEQSIYLHHGEILGQVNMYRMLFELAVQLAQGAADELLLGHAILY